MYLGFPQKMALHSRRQTTFNFRHSRHAICSFVGEDDLFPPEAQHLPVVEVSCLRPIMDSAGVFVELGPDDGSMMDTDGDDSESKRRISTLSLYAQRAIVNAMLTLFLIWAWPHPFRNGNVPRGPWFSANGMNATTKMLKSHVSSFNIV